MRPGQLDRLMALIKKTNDRLVVLDKASDFVTVLLPLDEYEMLVGESQSVLDWNKRDESQDQLGEIDIGDDAPDDNQDDDFDSGPGYRGGPDDNTPPEPPAGAGGGADEGENQEDYDEPERAVITRLAEPEPQEIGEFEGSEMAQQQEPVLPPDPVYTRIAQAEKQDETESHGAVPVYEPGKKTLNFSENWAQENTKPAVEEDLSDVPEDEEKFYLEPVE